MIFGKAGSREPASLPAAFVENRLPAATAALSLHLQVSTLGAQPASGFASSGASGSWLAFKVIVMAVRWNQRGGCCPAGDVPGVPRVTERLHRQVCFANTGGAARMSRLFHDRRAPTRAALTPAAGPGPDNRQPCSLRFLAPPDKPWHPIKASTAARLAE